MPNEDGISRRLPLRASAGEVEEAPGEIQQLGPERVVVPSFCDPSAEGADRAFSPATRRRLADVKDRYDPENVLRLSFGG
jgi:hypothetical protein